MKKRVISAIIALIIVVPLIALGGYAYYAGVGLLAIIGFNEIISVREKERKFPVVVKCLTLVSFLAIILFECNKTKLFDLDYRMLILDAFACFIPLIGIKNDKYNAADALFLLAVTIFLGMSFRYLIVIRNIDILYLIYVVLVTIMSDTFAHFFGTKIGRYKLAPDISPNKTVEGLIGGLFFGTFIGGMFFLTFINPEANAFIVMVVSLMLSLIAEFGDLVFSAIKRNYKVKDYGNIMPGHGGVLDRLDSIIFAVLAFSYLVSFF